MPKKHIPAHIKKLNKERKEAKEAADKAAEAAQEVQPIATPLDPPPSAPAQAKTGSIKSFFRSVEEQLVVPTPQLGSGSTGTASSAPGDAAQPKGIFGYPKSRGRVKGDGGKYGQGTAASREARVAQEGRNFATTGLGSGAAP